MNKRKYLKKLGKALKGVPEQEREDLISYYDELIEDGLEGGKSERSIFADLEPPEVVAENYLRDRAASSEGKRDTHVRDKSVFRVLGGLLAAILTIVLVSLLIAFVPTAVALAVAGVYTSVISFGLLFGGHAALFFAQWGMALALFALAVLFEALVVVLARLLAGMWRSVFGRGRIVLLRRGTRRALIAGSAMLLAACLTFTASFGTLGFDRHKLAVAEGLAVHEMQLSVSDALGLQADNFAVEVKRSEDETCKLVYRDFPEAPKRFAFTDGEAVLGGGGFFSVMGASAELQWRRGLFIGAVTEDMQKAELYLPASFAGDLTVKVENGSVSISDMVYANLAVVTNNGAVFLENVTAETVTAETVNGAIRLKNVACTRVLAAAYNGALSFEALTAEYIFLSTNNGAVSGTVNGRKEEYSINASCKVGSCNLQNSTGGEKQLAVSVSNGAVAVKFVG